MIIFKAIGTWSGKEYCKGDHAYVLRTLQKKFPVHLESPKNDELGRPLPRKDPGFYPEPIKIYHVDVYQEE